jgi:membrane protease YdiL (CAAX protease family)
MKPRGRSLRIAFKVHSQPVVGHRHLADSKGGMQVIGPTVWGESGGTVKKKQTVAILAPLAIIPFMILVYRWLAGALGETMGWYLGFYPYWILCCGLLSWWLLGRERICRVIRPQRLTPRILLLLSVPIVGAALYNLIPGMDYGQSGFWPLVMVISTAFGNGFFEELYWRGVYMQLFPRNLLFRILWPTLWFALWHYVPGTVSPNSNPLALMIGSGIYGLYLSFLTKKTDTIWWSIVAHTIGGAIMVL